MPMTANGLAKLLEELGELSQVAAKKLAYFDTDEHPDGAGSLQARMEAEIGDVLGAIDFVTITMGLSAHAIARRASEKLNTFRRWHADAGNGANAFDAAMRDLPPGHCELSDDYCKCHSSVRGGCVNWIKPTP